MSILVQGSCQEHTNVSAQAAAVVAVVQAVASALNFPLTPEEAALYSSKVVTAHWLNVYFNNAVVPDCQLRWFNRP